MKSFFFMKSAEEYVCVCWYSLETTLEIDPRYEVGSLVLSKVSCSICEVKYFMKSICPQKNY